MRRSRTLILTAAVVVAAGGTAVWAVSPASAAATTATFAKTSDWGSGWQGGYTITNGGSAALTSWKVEFDLPAGTTVGTYWDSVLTASGQHLTFTNREWNGTIAPNASVTFGFLGSGSGTPTGCKLNGATCTGGTIPGTPPTTVPTTPPTRPPTTPPTTAPTTRPPTTPPTPPPTTTPPSAACHTDAVASLTDYISDHREALTRTSCNADVAVYFDAELRALPASGTAWIAPFTTDVWRHIKASYGKCAVDRNLPAPIGPNCTNFGAPKPALAFYHQGKHGGGTVANRFDGFSGFRTTLDVGDTGWRESNAVLHDMITHEACHQVEGASQGVHESPAFTVWGDSKWAEFCVYDFYARTGRTADANRVLNLFTNGRDNLPSGARGAAWFRDWFLPLWKDGGNNAEVMQRYFGLLSQYFPTRSENSGRNLIYTRRMTTGEYVHFTSAAAGKDLSGRAATAFNSGFNRAEFEKAQRDFPAMKY
jgi:hypothetical protein